MLVLTRRNGERILIGDDIVVKVVRVKGDRVQIGVEAPGSVIIKRFELVFPGATPGTQEGDQKAPAA